MVSFAGIASRVRRKVIAATPRMRALPDFVIVGAAKAGTTSLFALLAQHPQILASSKKEVHFFDNNYSRGESWYRSHFPTMMEKVWQARLGYPVLSGEASPYYMFHPHAPRRMAEMIPDAKLIVLLRDPVERAYSHHAHNVRKKEEALAFEDAIAQEASRINGERERMLADETYYSQRYRLYSYARRGVYIDQVKHLHTYFPREQVLVINSESFFERPQDTLYGIYAFLGIKPAILKDLAPRNVGKYDSAPEHIDAQLCNYFREHNEALYNYLGVDYGWKSNARGYM